MPPMASPPRSGIHLLAPLAAGAGLCCGCCGAACCCAGRLGGVTLRWTPLERAPPRRAASASFAIRAPPRSAAQRPSIHLVVLVVIFGPPVVHRIKTARRDALRPHQRRG